MITWLDSTTNMFEYAEQNNIQTITNPCNCVGGWRAGISRQCGERYPASVARYKQACRADRIKPGQLFLSRFPDHPNILYFPTKNHYRNPSKLEWIESGLKRLSEKYHEVGITSIVIPPLGCGYGGLKWNDVKQLILYYLNHTDMNVYVVEKE